jgi:hypothetical protein
LRANLQTCGGLHQPCALDERGRHYRRITVGAAGRSRGLFAPAPALA